MNKIKFRLRDENKKIIGYEYFTQGEDLSGHWHYDFSMNGVKEWFQNFKWITKIRYRDLFSGLNDKNNKEIYANDVIKWFKEFDFVCSPLVGKEANTIEEALFQVIVQDGAFWAKMIKEDYEEHNTRLLRNACDNMFGNIEIPICEVIGDIYNNPELLKEEK